MDSKDWLFCSISMVIYLIKRWNWFAYFVDFDTDSISLLVITNFASSVKYCELLSFSDKFSCVS